MQRQKPFGKLRRLTFAAMNDKIKRETELRTMGFTEKALGFISENYMRNDREWFKAHKGDYEQLVLSPFAELLETLAPVMQKIDDKLICTPKCVSRIYRDARYVKGGAIFRDSLWCSVRRRKASAYDLLPEFYFYISLEGFGYGCGYYHTSTAAMEQLRAMALSGDKVFRAAKRAFEKQDRFYLGGEMYKKNRFPDCAPDLLDWVNRKSICVCYDSADSGELFDDALFGRVAQDMAEIAPIYRLYAEMEDRVLTASEKPHGTK